ncbi:alpha/beta hydrolase [Hymenobacter weizhouensis]|uniref:alpha/beta hydrolase n=1 Tax=Hymenobacter sp. YIM 151500-1 TaxID=2987689 RepID=UPI0022261022|nr:alpha/beta hydrolase [Hymenobacter sp. YIM 151500-1]UYZ63422.1 alpha/beta hydrolase [Hymenobacter sp. YIM 151500-1]
MILASSELVLKKPVRGLGWRAVLALLLGWLAATGAQAQAPAVPRHSLEGQWRGALTVPGGSLPLMITITEMADGNRFAVLDVPMQRVNREPMTMTSRGDTLVFETSQAGFRFVSLRSADGLQLLGTWQQPGYTVPLTLSFVPPAVAPKAFKFPPPYRVEEVTVAAADSVKLAGTLTIPAGTGPFTAVVLLSGQDPQTRDAVYGDYPFLGNLADYLTRHGIAVLRLDDRGTGQSGGDSTATTIADRTRDAQAALAFLRTRPLINASNLGLVGHGEGGNVALLAAAQPLGPKFVVTMGASGMPGRELLTQQRPSLLLRAGTLDTALLNRARRQGEALQAAKRQADKMRAAGATTLEVETFLAQQYTRQKADDKRYTEAQLKRRRAMFDIIATTPDNTQAQAGIADMLRQEAPGLDAAAVQAAAARLTTPAYRSYLRLIPQAELPKVRTSVLLLHGTADDRADAQTNLDLLTSGLKGARLTVPKLAGINHLFQAPTTEWPLINGQPRPVVSPAVLKLMLEWMQKEAKK